MKKNKISHPLSCKHCITLLKLGEHMTYMKMKEKQTCYTLSVEVNV